MELENLLSYESLRMKASRIMSECYILPDSWLSEKLEDLVLCMQDICEPALGFTKKCLKNSTSTLILKR